MKTIAKVPITKNNSSRAREKFTAIGKDFLANTSMHGLKYIGEHERHLFERILWIFMFGVGVSFSIYFCWGMLNKYSASPAVMSIENTDKKLATFPFPSVTICNKNKISKLKFDNLMKNSRYSVITPDQMKFVMLALLKIDETLHNRKHEIDSINNTLKNNGIYMAELVSITMQVMVSCKDILMDCQWLNRPTNCTDIFELIPTDEGFCCGFNPIQSGWKLQENLQLEPLKFNTIKTVHLPGYRVGLTVALDADLDDYAAATGSSDGFKVLLHHPPEYPEVGERGFLISPGFEIGSGLNPMSCRNTPEVDSLHEDQRRCYRDSENILKFHTNYSVSRCLLECMTNIMIKECYCRPFHYPGSEDNTICNLGDYSCLSKVYGSLRNESTFNESRDESTFNKCYPKCDDVWYFNDLSMAPFPGELFQDSRTCDRIHEMKNKSRPMSKSLFKGYLMKNVALLNVFYKEMTGYSYRKDARYGIDDFISSIGGLLGLGFGFSVISAIELVYFFGIRWIFNNRREAAIAGASSTAVSTAPKSNPNGKPSAIFTQPEQKTANKLSYNENNHGQFI